MGEEMKELHVEGLATHGDPESCVDDPRGRDEALAGARADRAIEPRNHDSGVPHGSQRGRQHCQQRYREPLAGPARSENQGMYGTSMRENRESPCPPVRAEAGEERERARGNTGSETRPGRSAGLSVSGELGRVRQVAVRDKEARFTALLHHVTLERLLLAYQDISPKAAPGVDGMTLSGSWTSCAAGSRSPGWNCTRARRG
jgi:hypothetical protein